jgi:hypothetical protein
MSDLVELEETAPTKRRRKIAKSTIKRVQHIGTPRTVIIFLEDGNSFVCTYESFKAANLDAS